MTAYLRDRLKEVERDARSIREILIYYDPSFGSDESAATSSNFHVLAELHETREALKLVTEDNAKMKKRLADATNERDMYYQALLNATMEPSHK
jgi:hypothetical protein